MRILTWLTVIFFIAIALGPFVAYQGKAEIASWYLAAARNAIDLGEGEPGELIEKARSWSGRVDLQAAQVELYGALKRAPAKFPKVFQSKIRRYPALQGLAPRYSQQLLVEGFRVEAVDVLKQLNLVNDLQNEGYLTHLNQLAYFRAVANYELDAALVDIETALANLPSDKRATRAAALDTRGWVLHKLGRNEEALVDVNKSIKLTEGLMTNLADLTAAGSSDSDAQEAGTDTGGDDGRSKASLPSDSRAALYYHRMKIHEALGNEGKASEDRKWLRSKGEDPDVELI